MQPKIHATLQSNFLFISFLLQLSQSSFPDQLRQTIKKALVILPLTYTYQEAVCPIQKKPTWLGSPPTCDFNMRLQHATWSWSTPIDLSPPLFLHSLAQATSHAQAHTHTDGHTVSFSRLQRLLIMTELASFHSFYHSFYLILLHPWAWSQSG